MPPVALVRVGPTPKQELVMRRVFTGARTGSDLGAPVPRNTIWGALRTLRGGAGDCHIVGGCAGHVRWSAWFPLH